MTALTFWTLAAGLGYAAVPFDLKIFFAKLDAAGYHSALVLMLLCVMHFAGLGEWAERTRFRVILFALPVLSVLLIASNELHGWIWSGFKPAGNNVLVFEHGPGFAIVAVTGYLLLLSMIGILVWLSRNGSDLRRRQVRWMLAASVVPLAANTLYQYGLEGYEGVDWSSVTFSITGLLFLMALRFAQFVDIVPIARDQLMVSLGDGMIVTDGQYRIIDTNPAAARIFGNLRALPVGTALKGIAPQIAALLESSPGRELRTEFETGGDPQQYFDVLVSPLYEKRQTKPMGNLIVFRDITERKTNELQFQQLSRAAEQSPTSIVITNVEGIITFVNPFFTMLTGYAPSEVVGKNPRIVQSGQTPKETYRVMWQTILSGRVWDGEFLNKKKNGELYWVHAVMAPVLNSDGNVQSFIAIQEDITERKLTEQALEQRFLEVQKLNKDLHEAQARIVEQQRALATAQERQRLGRNLHDSVNQSIHSLMLFAETLTDLLKNGQAEQAVRAAERIHEGGAQALREVRLLVYESRPFFSNDYKELVVALENRLDMVERRVGIRAELQCAEAVIKEAPNDWVENIYWIVLEALNNSLKHARARSVVICMDYMDDRITAEVKDDGEGFVPGVAGSSGFGIRSMRERANILGGELTVESSPGHGTCVRLQVKIER
jgi:PAS domain S-box-containing protein